MPLILTTQTNPQPGVGTRLPPVDVGSSTTAVIETLPFMSTLATTKWLVTMTVNDSVRFLEVSASCHINYDPKYTVFGDVGDRINAKPVVTKDPGGITLSIINNEASSINVQTVRIQCNCS